VLWEGEIKSRTQLVIRINELEDKLKEHDRHVGNERGRAAQVRLLKTGAPTPPANSPRPALQQTSAEQLRLERLAESIRRENGLSRAPNPFVLQAIDVVCFFGAAAFFDRRNPH
jgi:hypothetical protein